MNTNPNSSEYHNASGLGFYEAGQFEQALDSYRRALQLDPDFAAAHFNLGNAYYDIGQLDQAQTCYRRALEINPNFAEAHNNLADIYSDIGQLDAAVASYQRALELAPELLDARCNLAMTLRYLGRMDEALACIHAALKIDPDCSSTQSIGLFISNSIAAQAPAILLQQAQQFGDLVQRQAKPYQSWRNVADPEKCLRVGLVSGDLHNHPVGYFVEGLLAALSSQAAGRLQLIAYPSHYLSDALTERIKASCQGWHSAQGLSDEELAAWIREDGIDILIDLSGHTSHQRLAMFAWKPAPVQVSWLGYFATTGVAAIDYLIADPWTLAESQQAYFTEKIWRLAQTRLCFSAPDIALEVSPLPAIRNGYITFGCCNNLSKLNEAVVALWSRILKAVPDSRLLLKAIQLDEAVVRQDTLQRFAAHGITAARLTLQGPQPRKEYLRTYQQIDIALDPFPFPGGTTSVEGLWMGVPLLTLAGESFLSRQGLGILINAGLPEWIATDADDYVERALAHASNLQYLSDLRDKLRQQMLQSPLCDQLRFAENFEMALRGCGGGGVRGL